MFGLIRHTVNLIRFKAPQISLTSNFHFLAPQTHQLLAPKIATTQQTCGFKVKGRLRRRCKDCYFVRRQQRLYIICETHPRHKQMSIVKDPQNTWVLTHATQGKIRPW